MLESLRNKRILVVVAHPDDELLGLGGTINRLVRDFGCVVRALILGEGITSRSETRNPKEWKEELKIHKQNIESARKIIGYESVSTYDFPDNRFDTVALLDLIKVVEKEKNEFQPEAIFTHHGGDLNIDHRRTFESVMTAARPMQHEQVSTIVTFETPSGTEWQASRDPGNFRPNVWIELTELNLKAKIDAMECYHFEKRKFPHPRSSESLRCITQKNGIDAGLAMAERFEIIRKIERV